VRQQDGVGCAEESDELGQDVFYGGLSSNHFVGDAVHALNFWRNGYLRIDELFESGELTAVQSKAHGPYFDQPMHNREETSGLSIEGHNSDIRETWLGVVHRPSRPFPGELLTWKTAVSIDR
jgi:hypothetical protein